MTDAIEVTKTEVQCDNDYCDFHQDVPWEKVPDWLNVQCPACKNSIIVDDSDLASWTLFDELAPILNNVFTVPEGEEPVEAMLNTKHGLTITPTKDGE